MKVTVILPAELTPVKKALEDAFDQAIAEVATGTREGYASGRLSMVTELISTVETLYDVRRKQNEEKHVA